VAKKSKLTDAERAALLAELDGPSAAPVRTDHDSKQPPRRDPAPKRSSVLKGPVRDGMVPQPAPAPRPVQRGKNVDGKKSPDRDRVLGTGDPTPPPPVAAKPAPGKVVAGSKGVFESATIQPIDPKHYPKRWKEGELKRGDSVWYRNERYWVEWAPKRWSDTCYVRMANQAVRQEPHPLPSEHPNTNTLVFCVHADLLTEAPVTKNLYARQPTLADVARKERASKGVKDVGDEVAERLRSCKSLDEMYESASDYLDVPVSKLKEKYGKLNPGQQRMNLGNRMRHQWRKNNGQ
jgi:hypothetical protein